MANLPPAPRSIPQDLLDWLEKVLVPHVTKEGRLAWVQIQKEGAKISDFEEPETPEAVAHRTGVTAHGASGEILGSGDQATESRRGPVFQVPAITPIPIGSLPVGGTYSSSQVLAIANRANENSNKINEIITALKNAELMET